MRLGVTESQIPTLLANDSVQRLFGNSREVEAAYFRKTKILPIMHVLALQKNIADRYPELPAQAVSALRRLKAMGAALAAGNSQLGRSLAQSLSRPRSSGFLERIPGRTGWKRTGMCSISFLRYCHAQGITARNIAPEEIFHPGTLKLVE